MGEKARLLVPAVFLVAAVGLMLAIKAFAF